MCDNSQTRDEDVDFDATASDSPLGATLFTFSGRFPSVRCSGVMALRPGLIESGGHVQTLMAFVVDARMQRENGKSEIMDDRYFPPRSFFEF
mgnify:CR=1